MPNRLPSLSFLVGLTALVQTVTTVAPAAAWEFVDVLNAYGDKATGIVQPARNDPDTVLAVGCDGDRWRIVMIAPRSERGVELDRDGETSFSFGPQLGPAEKWLVRKRPSGQLTYQAPESTSFVSLLVGEERKSADATLRVAVRSRDRRVVLEFPLAGLRSAIRKDLWTPCKLENYFPDAAGG